MARSLVFFLRASADEPADVLSGKARAAYLALGLQGRLTADDFIALKIHFGEKGNTGFIRSAWLRGPAEEIQKKTMRAFLTDSNTLYVGERSNSVDHIRLAWSHGFRPEIVGLPVIIADGLVGRDKGEAEGRAGRVKSAKIAGAILASDALLVLTHVTGHVQTGIGAAIKNLGMGCASRAGKLDQHSVVHPRVSPKRCRDCGLCLEYCPAGAILRAEGRVLIDGKTCLGCGECMVACKYGAIKVAWDDDTRRIQEKVAEYAFLVKRHFGAKAGCLNFLLKVTKDCDCMAKDQPRLVEDIGILASDDPVAVDQASADLVLQKSGGRDVFRAGYDIDWSVQLSRGQALGLGSRAYDLVELKSP
ncbi:MAG: DUF362 domain-containing protein [Candidatus Aminicenantes bacterium]|nr:DUF362 domain-containing protein [Candidatus Aminicenantes bacterium]